MDNTIEVCSVCHYRIPIVLGYLGKIHCHCGKEVFNNIDNVSFVC